jgi:hypothetical protein
MRSRSDTNQAEIVTTLRQLGAAVKVVSTHAIGCDLLVEWRGRLFMVEVKRTCDLDNLTDNEHETQAQFEQYIVTDSAESFIAQAENKSKFSISDQCWGSDFAVLLKFNLRTQKREIELYGRDQEQRSRARRLAEAIFKQKRMLERI